MPFDETPRPRPRRVPGEGSGPQPSGGTAPSSGPEVGINPPSEPIPGGGIPKPNPSAPPVPGGMPAPNTGKLPPLPAPPPPIPGGGGPPDAGSGPPLGLSISPGGLGGLPGAAAGASNTPATPFSGSFATPGSQGAAPFSFNQRSRVQNQAPLSFGPGSGGLGLPALPGGGLGLAGQPQLTDDDLQQQIMASLFGLGG